MKESSLQGVLNELTEVKNMPKYEHEEIKSLQLDSNLLKNPPRRKKLKESFSKTTFLDDILYTADIAKAPTKTEKIENWSDKHALEVIGSKRLYTPEGMGLSATTGKYDIDYDFIIGNVRGGRYKTIHKDSFYNKTPGSPLAGDAFKNFED